MYSVRRLLAPTGRGSRARLQFFGLAVFLTVIAYFFYNRTDNNDDRTQTDYQINTIPLNGGGPTISHSMPEETVATDSNNCAYKNCPKLDDDVVNVHVICHTHLDPGWLNSVDGYFFGIQYQRNTNNGGQVYRHTMPSVLTIFNNVMGALLENSRRRFVMVEMSFIWRWWKRLDDDYKKIVRKLIEEGRIDIAGGSWTSNDEAVSHYSAMIDQSTLGLRFLKSELRTCPQPAVAWQLDLFGHGREINSLFAQMGYDAILFGRLDYQEKEQRTAQKTLQMVWDVNEHAPDDQRWLFTGILPNLYHPPERLALKSDIAGSLLRPNDTETIPESASSYSKQLLAELRNQYERYGSNNLLLIYGGDFEYEDATQYFQNIDAMIDTINSMNQTDGKKRFHFHYSTPTCFLRAVSRENRAWPTRQGDFMSYAHRAHAFWTGFYTSRPGIKLYERSLAALYHSLRQLSLTSKNVDFARLFSLSEIMGLLQHHDTITGTSPQINIQDILQRMHQTEIQSHIFTQSIYENILKTSPTVNWKSPLIFCQLNESICAPIADFEKFSVILYNPSTIANEFWLRIPVRGQKTISLDKSISDKFTVNPKEIGLMPISPNVLDIPIKQKRNQYEEYVLRVSLPPLTLQALPFKVADRTEKIESLSAAKIECSIENEKYILKVNAQGSITTLEMKDTKTVIDFKQTFGHYSSSSSDQLSHQQSGLYVFRPIGMNPPQKVDIKEFYCIKKPGYEEIIQVYSKYASQSIRLLEKSSHIEFDWIVGKLDPNVEFVTTYRSDAIRNDGVFYTDSSGRSLMKRKRDQRDGYKFTQSIKTAGNYYPLVTGIIIKDQKDDLQMSIVTDRAEGGGSIEDGAIEIMVNRRVHTDDGLGVSEVLNEVGPDGLGLVIRGRHLIHVGKRDDGIRFFREHALKSVWKPIVAFRNDAENPQLSYDQWSLVKSKLPEQVNLLTVEPIDQDKQQLTVLVRLEHIYEVGEHSTLSTPISVDLRTLFDRHEFLEAREVTLAANMFKDKSFERLKWKFDSAVSTSSSKSSTKNSFDGHTANLSPMEIRSFFVKLTKYV